MNLTGGIRPFNSFYYSPGRQANPLYCPKQQDSAYFPRDKKKLKNLIIQSYWVIWLLLSFIIAYALGYLILESPMVFEYR